MADDADRTSDRMDKEEALRDRARPAAPYEPPAGVAGDCVECGEPSPRLIGGACPPCRDRHGLR